MEATGTELLVLLALTALVLGTGALRLARAMVDLGSTLVTIAIICIFAATVMPPVPS